MLFVLLLLVALSPHASEQSRVLVIYSNLDVSPWVHKFNSALFKDLRAETDIHLRTEALAFSDYSEEELVHFGQLIQEKHKSQPPELIIGVLPAANEFIRTHLKGFEHTPRLYVLPDQKLEKEVGPGNHIISSVWHTAVAETMEIMRVLMPELQHVYLLSGATIGNYSYLRRSKTALEPYQDSFQFFEVVGASGEEMAEILNKSPSNSAAMLLTYDGDRQGRKYSNPQIMVELEDTKIPIFTMLETILEDGVVGGSITNATLYGEATAHRALVQLGRASGETTSHRATEYVFNTKRLKHFELDLEDLPEGSTLLNHEPSLWQQYWLEFVAAFTLLAVQSLMILRLILLTRAQRRSQRMQDNQRRQFEAVINGIPDAIIVTDASGKIVALNHPGSEDTFGAAQDHYIGHSVNALFTSPLPDGELINHDIHCQTGSQQRFPGEVTLKHITDVDGKVSGRFYVIRDISERQVREEELRQAQKMEAIGNLAGGIAHDFNNILMAIIGNAEIAQDPDTKPSEHDQSLDSILNAGKRASELIAEIMQFSRGDAEGMANLDLKQLLEESETLIRASFHGLVINFKICDDLTPIHGNGTQIQRVLLNLCSNAAHALEGHGEITISAQTREFTTDAHLNFCLVPAGEYVEMSIEDNGPGIDPEILPRIFEPFFTTKTQGQGTGIGLATVYKTVQSHDGYIDLTSNNTGAKFSVFLPSSEKSITSDKPIKSTIQSRIGEGKKVLLVDDDEMVLKTSKASLSKLMFDVESYSSALEAVESCKDRASQFDLIITDYAMPELSGLDLIKKLSKNFGGEVLICTGNRNVDESLRNSTKPILNKPYTTADLSQAIESLIIR